MKYRILFSLLLLGNNLWAMEAAKDTTKGKDEQDLSESLFLASPEVLEGDGDVVKANPTSSDSLDALFPPCDEDQVIYHENGNEAEAQDEAGNLFDTLMGAQATITEIKGLPADERAARTKDLENAVEVLLRKRAENAHQGQKLSREQLDAQRKKEAAIAASQRVDSSVELNARERQLLGEVARSLSEVLPEHKQADLEAILQDMSHEESRGFWRWATSWVPNIRCVIQ